MIWTGELNDPYRLGGKVGLYDTTLRDGEQTVGVVLDPEQKLEIARLLDGLGIDRIEAGFPRVSQDDWDAVRLISDAGLDAEVWGFSRAVPADLEALVELGVSASVIESPISDLKLEAIGVSREKMLGPDHGCDALRRRARDPRGVLRRRLDPRAAGLLRAGLQERRRGGREGGCRRRHARDRLAGGGRRPGRPNGRVGRAGRARCTSTGTTTSASRPAAAVAAVRAGARWVHGTINGMGERAGNANLGEVALTLRALYGVESNLRLERVREVSERVRELSGYALEPWKPVTGETLFRRESGAVASQFHDPPSIEPYSSELVGAERGIVLGKKSGLDSIRIKAEELGLDLPEERYADVLARVKELGTRKRGLVTDDEFRELARG